MSSFGFRRRKSVIQVWNDMRASNWWWIFGWTILAINLNKEKKSWSYLRRLFPPLPKCICFGVWTRPSDCWTSSVAAASGSLRRGVWEGRGSVPSFFTICSRCSMRSIRAISYKHTPVLGCVLNIGFRPISETRNKCYKTTSGKLWMRPV